MSHSESHTGANLNFQFAKWRDYYELCKPRVVALMLLTAWVGMCLATPGWVNASVFVLASMGIALAAGSAAVINHCVDHHLDTKMRRTYRRPVAAGRVSIEHALGFAVILGVVGLGLLAIYINLLTAGLTFITLIGYALVYTLYLKHATPQNIVIGGIAGAAPPLLGWTAVTGALSPEPLLLVLIIFVWTPPHFWALAIHRRDDYANAKVPMLPITHGIRFTKISILLYTIMLCAVSLLPYLIGMSGLLYLIGASVLGVVFMLHAVKLMWGRDAKQAMRTFYYSIYYLMFLFVVLLADHYLA